MSCDVTHVGECDRRKEQLLQLQRSKLERHMREMDTLKKVYTSKCIQNPIISVPVPGIFTRCAVTRTNR